MTDQGQGDRLIVGILGAGTIGASWTALFLARGLTVQVHDPSPTQERDVRAYVANAWPALSPGRVKA